MSRGVQAGLLVPALILVAVMALSVHLGPDASWDLRNYHIYNPFALLHKAPGTDLLLAQLQGFLPPFADIPAYWLRLRLNAYPAALDAILGLPSAVAAVLAYFIMQALVPPGTFWLAALLAVAYGVTGAGGLPTTGTVASEMPGACFILGAVLLLLRGSDQPGRRILASAGALTGIALGIKLTVAPFAIALALATALCCRGGLARRAGAMLWLGLGCAAGLVASAGPWWLHLYLTTGNPIFPYYNNIFHSPLTAPIAMTDDRFRPRSWLQAWLYPFYWGFQKNRLVTELTMRDPRLAFSAAALLAFAARAVWRRDADRAASFIAVFLATGFVLWQAEFSIFRYIAPLELLSGAALLLALRPVLMPPAPALRAEQALLASLVLGLFLALFTRYPDWGRANPAARALAIGVPPIQAGSMVLILTNDPAGYIAAFADPAIRFVNVASNIARPGDTSVLARRVEAAVRGFTGPLLGIEPAGPSQSGTALAYYGLVHAGACAPVVSNLDGSAFRLCPLERRP